MSKSKQVGNVKLLVAESRMSQEELFDQIEKELIPIWLEKSQVNYTLDEKKKECWLELLKTLYKCKAINIKALLDQIEYYKGIER